MVLINVDGKDYELTQKQVNLLGFVKKSIAIEQGAIKIQLIDQKTFEFILKILEDTNYELKEIPKVATSVLEDVVGRKLASLIGHLNVKDINNLYKAAHFLQIRNLKKAIAAVLATRIYIRSDLKDYIQKTKQLKLNKQLTTEDTKSYQERFPWMNQ